MAALAFTEGGQLGIFAPVYFALARKPDGHLDPPSSKATFEVFRPGYLRIERITTDEEVGWRKGITDQLFAERAGEEEGLYYDLAAPWAHKGRELLPQVLGPDFRFPELRESQYYRNAIKLGTQLLGVDEKVTAGGRMIFKPARHGTETPWHQDEAYWNPDVPARVVHEHVRHAGDSRRCQAIRRRWVGVAGNVGVRRHVAGLRRQIAAQPSNGRATTSGCRSSSWSSMRIPCK